MIVLGVWAVDPTYGVILYDVTGPPLDGADQDTVAEVDRPAVALTPVTCPGAEAERTRTSTQ